MKHQLYGSNLHILPESRDDWYWIFDILLDLCISFKTLKSSTPDKEWFGHGIIIVLDAPAKLIEIIERAIVRTIDWDTLTCKEACQFSIHSHIDCGAPAEAIVWHNNDRKAYPMCGPCSYHNEKNRRAIVLRRK